MTSVAPATGSGSDRPAGEDLQRLADWVGRTETRVDTVGPAPLAALAALLDRDDPPPAPGDPIAPLAHWLYFLPTDRQSALGPDGHARRGGFLPPVPLPRRMWAGSRIEFRRPIAVGDTITRLSRIDRVQVKQGRSGTLVFVTVRHEVSDAGGVALTDEHDLVYRGPTGTTAAPIRAPTHETWSRTIRPDPVLLFRYSALTYNGHRIHYDHPYATGVEGYAGLVVHAPLIATLLVDLLRRNRPEAQLASFSFRAVRPLFDTLLFTTCGVADDRTKRAELWTRDAEGALTMQASAAWR